jgi:hypothetical protein
MKVRTLKMCFVGGSRYRVGSVLEVPDDLKLPPWLVPVSASDPAKVPPVPAPSTFSEINAAESAALKKWDPKPKKGAAVDSLTS